MDNSISENHTQTQNNIQTNKLLILKDVFINDVIENPVERLAIKILSYYIYSYEIINPIYDNIYDLDNVLISLFTISGDEILYMGFSNYMYVIYEKIINHNNIGAYFQSKDGRIYRYNIYLSYFLLNNKILFNTLYECVKIKIKTNYDIDFSKILERLILVLNETGIINTYDYV